MSAKVKNIQTNRFEVFLFAFSFDFNFKPIVYWNWTEEWVGTCIIFIQLWNDNAIQFEFLCLRLSAIADKMHFCRKFVNMSGKMDSVKGEEERLQIV